jgi:hypothetical protein
MLKKEKYSLAVKILKWLHDFIKCEHYSLKIIINGSHENAAIIYLISILI